MKTTTAQSSLASRNNGKRLKSPAPQCSRIEPLEARIAPAAILITPETEPNNTFATAHALTLHPVAGASAAINPGGDVDFFSFPVNVGDRVWIGTDTGGTQNAGATSRDTVIDLLDTNGTTVLENDDDDGTGNGGDGTVETGLASVIGGKTITTAGTDFVKVRAFSATAIVNPYTVYVAKTTAAQESAEVEGNNTAATANTIIPGGQFIGVRKGSIGVAGDVDYYSFTATAGQRFFFVADGDTDRDGTGTDLVLEVRDSADVLQLSVDSSTTAGSLANPSAEGANFVATASGTYYIKVRHFEATGTGTYDLMVANGSTPPPPVGVTVFGVTTSDHLVSFNSAAPGTLLTDVAVTGLQASERLEAVEFRPATGQLYGLVITDADPGPDSGHLVTIDPVTALATPVNGGTPFSTTLINSSAYGFDFNPTVDRIRIVNDNDQNLRVNPNDGTLAATDTDLAFPAAGDTNSGNSESVVAVAYDRSGGGPALTTLFGIDFNSNDLVRIGGVDGTPSPNGGVVSTIGDSGLAITLKSIGFDIDSGSGTAYLSAHAGGTGGLYTVDLATGLATAVGVIGGGGTDLRSLTVVSTTLVVAGTGIDDTMVVTATGPDSGTYTLNGGTPVPFTGITAFTFDGGLGNDLLQVNNPVGGLFAPSGGIFYNGQGQTGTPGDRLEILGGAHTTETHNFAVDAPVGQHNGGITLINGGTTATYAYTGLSPILVNAGTPADIIFNLPAGTNPDAVIGDDGGAADPDATQDPGFSAISGSTFEFTQFVNPTNSLTINGTGTNSDTITLKAMDALFAPGGATPFLIAPGAGTDTINVQATTAGITTLVRGGSEADVMNVSSTAPTNTGTLDNILGIVRFEGAAGIDTLNVSDSGDADADALASITDIGGNITTLAGFAPAQIQYTDQLFAGGGLENLNVFGGSGGNTITVNHTTASVKTVLDSGAGNDTVTITGAKLSADNQFLGNDGNDEFALNISTNIGADALAGFPILSASIEGGAGAAGAPSDSVNRDRLEITDNAAATQRFLNYHYVSTTSGDLDIEPVFAGTGLFGGADKNLQVRTMETVIFSTPANDDFVNVEGSTGNDVLTVGLVNNSNTVLVFSGGTPYLGTAPETLADSRPGVAGGGFGPDLGINGMQTASGIFLAGGGTPVGGGDRAVVYAASENNLTDVGNPTDIFGFGAGVLIPGFGAGNAYDTITVDDASVKVTNNSSGALTPVLIDTNTFVQGTPLRKALIVNAGDEAAAQGNGIADDITGTLSTNFAIAVNGGLPSSAGPNPFAGDRLSLVTPAEVNVFSDTAANVTITSGGSAGFGFSSIENITFTPSNGSQTVNLIGDNNDPLVDQKDLFDVRGFYLLPNNTRADVDSNLAAIPGAQNEFQPDSDGDNEFYLLINGSSPIGFRNVRTLNTFGDDQNPAPGTPSLPPNDEDTLDVTPFADNTGNSRQWDIGVAFDEGNPSPGGKIILRGVPGVPESVTHQKTGPESGVITDIHSTTHQTIVIITYKHVSNVQFITNPGDGDTLIPSGTGFGLPGAGSDAFTAGVSYGLTQVQPLPAKPILGKGPTSVAVGDINGDTFPDMVSANSKTHNLSILLGLGDGTFGVPTNILSGGKIPTDIALADIDGINGLDIVVTNAGTKSVAVLKNNGLGVFGAPVLTVLKLAPTALAVGDLGGSALPEVVVTHAVGSVSVLLNTAGTLGGATTVKTGGKGTVDVAVGDFDGDADQDIATVNGITGNVSFLENAGGALFNIAPQLFKTGVRPTALAVADFNNDGKLDLAVSHAVSRFVAVLIGNGAAPGAQFKQALRVNTPGLHFPKSIAAGDFNGDGNVDLALGPTVGGKLRVILGAGQGDFSQPFEFNLGNEAARVVSSVAIADVNLDGALDIITANTSSNDLSVLLRRA